MDRNVPSGDPGPLGAATDPVNPIPTQTLAIVNASDDIKINSLRKNSPHLLTLSEGQGIPDNNETIAEPAPDYPVSPEPSTNSILKTSPDKKAGAANKPETRLPTSGSRDGKIRDMGGRGARSFNKRKLRGRRRRPELSTSGHGADNPIFQAEDGDTSRRSVRSEAEKGNGLRKKVSWNETVVYNSEEKTDVIIAGLHEEESDTDDTDVGEYRYPVAPRAALSIIPEDQPIPGRTGGSTRDDERWLKRSKQGHRKDKASDYKCPLCSAVVLIALAVVGIVVLGTMYGVRYGNEKSTSDVIAGIKETFSLLPSGTGSLFLFSLYRPPSYQVQDGASYFLLEKDSIMPWQSPDGAATLTWLQGSPVKVEMIDRRGRVLLRLLSDPVIVQGAQYTISMYNTDWYAAKLHDPSSYALVAMSHEGMSSSWTRANISELFKVVTLPHLRDKIAEYSIRQL